MNANALIRGLAASAATALTTLAIPDIAGAADYCVGQGLGCDDPHTVTFLDQALDKADDNADADRILLSAGTHQPSTASGFSYDRDDGPVEIVGQGTGKTVLTRPILSNGFVLSLYGGAGSSVHDLTVRIPAGVQSSFTALNTSNTARRVEVIEDATQSNQRVGVALFGGTLEDSTVTLDGTQQTWGVRFLQEPGIMRRSAVSAQLALYSYFGGTVERSRLTGSNVGAQIFRGSTTVASSVIRVGDGGISTAVYVPGFAGYDTDVNLDGVTAIGPGGGSKGIFATNGAAPSNDITVNVANSIIRGVWRSIYAGTAAGVSGHVSVATRYSDYDPTGNETEGNASITESNLSNVGDAGFVDAPGGDFRLVPSSPLIDAGDPATAQGLDLDGNPLVVDGDADGTARRDLGAYEAPQPSAGPNGGAPVSGGGTQPGASPTGSAPALDLQAPLVTGFRATPTRRGARVRYTLSESAKVTLKIQRAVRGSRTRYRTIGTLTRTAATGANSARLAGRLAKRVRVIGRYRVRIAATDMAGNRAAPKLARFRVLARA